MSMIAEETMDGGAGFDLDPQASSSGSGRRMGRRWKRLLPEGLTLILVTALQLDWTLLLLPTLVRATVLGSIAVHELAHAVVAGGLSQGRLRGAFPISQPAALLPFGPLALPGSGQGEHWPSVRVADLSRRRRRLAAIAGPAANVLLMSIGLALLVLGEGSSVPDWLAPLLIATNLWLLASSWSDYATVWSGRGSALYCGNFGILAKRRSNEHGFLPARFRRLFERLGQVTDLRGQQAGGVAVMGACGRFIGRKVVNPKRGNLTRVLLGAFERRSMLRRFAGARPRPEILHLIAHYRYGTSSGPSVVETHWHRWLPPRRVPVWTLDGTRMLRRRRVVESLITHNGDFDAWETTSGGRMDQVRVGEWLAAILGEGNPARGDSPKIAGLMDLLLTQGQWLPSLRLAYALRTGGALPQAQLAVLAKTFEQVFAAWLDGALDNVTGGHERPVLATCNDLGEVYAQNPRAIQQLVDALRQAALAMSRDWPEEAKQWRAQIVGRTVHAFFNNDLFRATRLFMEHAQGTFGLVTTSSLQPGVVVLAADRQPLFVGADPRRGLLVYASEAAALKAVGEPGSDAPAGAIPYRLDLRDGDLVELQVHAGTADNAIKLVNRHRDDPPVSQRITTEALAEAVHSASANDSGLVGWVPMHDNPYVEAELPASGKDRVLAEMTDIPRVLERVRISWGDPASTNRRTADAFADRFLDGALRWLEHQQGEDGPRMNAELDLLVLGVENSLFLGQRFVEDLCRLFPYVNAEAVDAVAYCEDPQRLPVGPSTLTLAISHSGQTFNTLDAVKFLSALYRLGKAGPVFVMTGEVDTLMGAAVGQGVRPHSEWVERVFDSCAGWCTAEPATVSVAATHASLTELLLRMIHGVQDATEDDERPYGLAASEDDLAKLEALATLSISRAEAIFGRTAEGWDVQTEERDALLSQGRYLSRLLVEPMLVFLVTAAHLFVMLWLGWNPVIGANALLYGETGWAFFDPSPVSGHLILTGFETAYFLFASIAFTLALRLVQGRPLWDRILVARSLVIGDLAYVKDLLAQYVSKLFSLAYGFASLAGVHAADSRRGELLHGYGHRICRGVILFLGLPDGRWCGRERAEAAICMTSSQARGVQNMGTGATVFGIGHNPASKARVDRFILLGLSNRRAEDLPWVLRGDWSELARDLQETRFASFERLLGAYVLFHRMAADTRDLVNHLVPVGSLLAAPIFLAVRLLSGGRARPGFGRWDLARTQSGTRIATTAAPVGANTQDPVDYRIPQERYASPPPPRHRRPAADQPLVAALAAPARLGAIDGGKVARLERAQRGVV
jgi:hypothetical protein